MLASLEGGSRRSILEKNKEGMRRARPKAHGLAGTSFAFSLEEHRTGLGSLYAYDPGRTSGGLLFTYLHVFLTI